MLETLESISRENNPSMFPLFVADRENKETTIERNITIKNKRSGFQRVMFPNVSLLLTA
jgi:hypothetical protein